MTQRLGTGGRDRNIGRLIGGRYRLVELVGRGGMGSVYRAVHTHMQKDFAVKLLRSELSATEEALRRFENEANAVNRLAHPNCVRVTDFGRSDDGGMFLVMEYLAGRSLAALLAAEGRLPPERAVHIAAQVLDAVQHAHAAGIVHRDLKPENVMLVEVDGDPDAVKILDFGIARVLDGERAAQTQITEAGAVFGTPEYLSPEQALGERADARADVYAIGVILYEMLAGRRPFTGQSKMEVLSAHLTREPPRLSDVAPEISAELETVVMRALHKRRDERWQSAAAFLEALRSAPARSPVARKRRVDAPEDSPKTAPLSRHGAAGAAPAGGAEAAASETPVASETPAAWETHAVPATSAAWKGRAGRGAPAAVELPAMSAASRRRVWPWAVAAVLALVLVVIVGVSGGRDEAARTADLGRVRTMAERGEWARARKEAERLAHRFPDDARVFALLGDVLMMGERDPDRALAAYRTAVSLDREIATRESDLISNVKALSRDRAHGRAARMLADELGLASNDGGGAGVSTK